MPEKIYLVQQKSFVARISTDLFCRVKMIFASLIKKFFSDRTIEIYVFQCKEIFSGF